MCVAVPGLVVEIKENIAKVFITGLIIEVDISLVPAKIGDYVLIHAGCGLEILKKETAEEMIQLFNELQEVIDG